MDPETGYGLPISEIYNWCSLLILEFYWLNFCVRPLAWYSNPMRALITDQNSMQKMKRIIIGMEEYTAVADYKKSCLNSIRQNNNVLISSKLYIYISSIVKHSWNSVIEHWVIYWIINHFKNNTITSFYEYAF